MGIQSNESRAFDYLDQTYNYLIPRLKYLHDQSFAQRPYFTRRLFEITDEVCHNEGLKQGRAFKDQVSMRSITRGDCMINWPLIMQWGARLDKFNAEGVRQRRSKLAFDHNYAIWDRAVSDIQDVVRNHLQMEPNVRQSLQDLLPVKRTLDILRYIKDGKPDQGSSSGSNDTSSDEFMSQPKGYEARYRQEGVVRMSA